MTLYLERCVVLLCHESRAGVGGGFDRAYVRTLYTLCCVINCSQLIKAIPSVRKSVHCKQFRHSLNDTFFFFLFFLSRMSVLRDGQEPRLCVPLSFFPNCAFHSILCNDLHNSESGHTQLLINLAAYFINSTIFKYFGTL